LVIDLVIGAPYENLGGATDAGSVAILFFDSSIERLTGAGSKFFTQDTPGIGGSAEDNDRFGNALG
jgi:hypothetical protein